MNSSEITPVSQKIDRLIKRVEDGDIKIPGAHAADVGGCSKEKGMREFSNP